MVLVVSLLLRNSPKLNSKELLNNKLSSGICQTGLYVSPSSRGGDYRQTDSFFPVGNYTWVSKVIHLRRRKEGMKEGGPHLLLVPDRRRQMIYSLGIAESAPEVQCFYLHFGGVEEIGTSMTG